MWRAIPIIILLTILAVNYLVKEPAEVPEMSDKIVMIQGNTLMGIAPPHRVVFKSLAATIDCLEFYESSGNPNAVGKAGEIGCLQFMPSTFQMFCVDMYGLKDNIWNCELQKLCANLMIGDKYERVNHWTTYKFCN